MSDNLFVNINGKVVSSAEAVLSADNRSFRYGDGIFETIRFANGKIQFLDKHVKRIHHSLGVIKIDVPSGYNEDYFRPEIEKLVRQNGVEKGARIRLTLFRKEGGYYTPHNDEPNFLIECEPIDEAYYNLNPKGYSIDIYPDYKKSINKLSNIKSNNALLNVLAGVYRKQNDLDDCVILNQNFGIAECISSNIFAVKNGVLYTPPIMDGCVDGIMRRHIIEVARANRISVYEVSLQMNVLLNSDEIFLTNVISGVRWVGAYKAKRFYNNMAKLIIDKLNESLA
ncbi:MAG TPA: aminotransferase class IV [Bacteroidia bacterium]|jgi:branched-chain amino acid aminotransferase